MREVHNYYDVYIYMHTHTHTHTHSNIKTVLSAMEKLNQGKGSEKSTI